MYSLNVRTAHINIRPIAYDLNVIVLIHYSGKYRHRVDFFKRFGLHSFAEFAVHVTLVASEGDGVHSSELLHGWPNGVDVTLLEMSSDCPAPKLTGCYFWLRDARICAKWHLRVDDDSITDIAFLLQYAETHYAERAIHLMTDPHPQEPEPLFSPILAAYGSNNVSTRHEYESSLTSGCAFENIWNNECAVSFLAEAGQMFSGPGDRTLAMAIHLAGIEAEACPIMSKDFRQAEMSIADGPYAHVHYVNWQDSLFVKHLRTFICGQRKPLNGLHTELITGRALPFGRCVGFHLAGLILHRDGRISGSGHPNETSWSIAEGKLLFRDPDGAVTTAFSTELRCNDECLLLGACYDGISHHYLQIATQALRDQIAGTSAVRRS
jgi:hypothetical protein